MKRHFMKSLKALGMGVMALVAASSLVVSCYDDSALRGEISGVKEDLKGLKARLDSLENKLSSQITAVQAIYASIEALEGADETLGGEIDATAAKIKVAEVKTLDNGKVSIVLTDGTSFQIEPASKNANPIVTVVDGKWALVDAKTGQASVIEIDGASVPVAHPDFKIRFNDSTRLIEVSVDGGTTWTASDVEIPEQQEIPECNALIEDIYEDGKGNIVFYTVWGEEIVLGLAQEFSFNIKSGRLSFAYGATKEVAVEVNNVADYAVMTKPEGWKATFVDENLVITAPAEDAVNAGTADAEGFVRVHVATTDGKCKVAKLGVSVLPGLSVSVDALGNITVTNPFGSDGIFDAYYLGFTRDIETFEADPAAFVENLDMNWEVVGSFPYNLRDFEDKAYTYDEVENPVDTLKVSIADYANMLYSPAPERGQAAIVFVLGNQLDAESLAFVYYEPKEAVVIVDTTSITWNDAAIEAHMYGYDSYEYGVAASEDYLYEGFMQWQQYFKYGVSMGGMVSYENGSYEGTLSAFGLEPGAESSPLMPGTTYYAYVLGMTDGMDPYSLTWEDFRANNVIEIKTHGLVSGGAATSSATFTQDYTKVTAELTASDDAYLLWHGFFAADAITAEMTDEQLVELLLTDGYMVSSAQLPYTFNSEQARLTLGSGTAVKYVSVAVNANGEYGKVNVQETATKEFVYSETFSVAVDGDPVIYLDGSYANVYVKFAAEGGNIKKIRYKNVKAADTKYTDEFMAKDMPVNNLSTYTTVDVATLPGGILRLQSLSKGTEYRLGFIAYDENGEVAEYESIAIVIPTETVDLSADLILKDDEGYATSKPTYTFTKVSGNSTYAKYSCTVEVPEGCMAWVGMEKPEKVAEAGVTAVQMVNKLAAGSYQSKYFVGTSTQDINYVYPNYNFYIAWIDADGKYHEAEVVPVSSLTE